MSLKFVALKADIDISYLTRVANGRAKLSNKHNIVERIAEAISCHPSKVQLLLEAGKDPELTEKALDSVLINKDGSPKQWIPTVGYLTKQ